MFSLNQGDRWALGNAYRFVHRHANKAVSFITTIENYQDGLQMTREWAQNERDKGNKMDVPPKVSLNKDNVPDVQRYSMR